MSEARLFYVSETFRGCLHTPRVLPEPEPDDPRIKARSHLSNFGLKPQWTKKKASRAF